MTCVHIAALNDDVTVTAKQWPSQHVIKSRIKTIGPNCDILLAVAARLAINNVHYTLS